SYLFAVSFSGALRRERWTVAAGYAVSAFFTFKLFTDTPWMLEGMHHYFFGWYSAYGPGMKYFLLSFTALMGACLAELFRMWQASRSGLERRQVLWVLAGFGIASFGSVDYLPGYGIEA